MATVARSVIDRALRAIAERAASAITDAELVVRFPEGGVRTFGRPGAAASARIDVHSDEFFRRVLLHGEIGFGEAYVDRLWDSDDLVRLLVLAIEQRGNINERASWLALPSRIVDLRGHRARRNTRERAKENIHAHYDLGNEFFSLFLDETMTYSCAYFESPGDTLADAQRNKYRRLCDLAGIEAGQDVLEIGCGWGGFALYAAGRHGCRVTSITISREQQAYALRRVAEAGLADLVDVRLCDYREIEGSFDRIVSIEMFEAVGAEYFSTFFEACDRALRPGGRMAMQTIAVPDRSFEALRDGVNWMQKYIFPGGMLPSIAEIEQALRDTPLLIASVEDIGAQYARTLRMWRERFLDRRDAVRALGFDERFVRMWEYYLAASEAGFVTRNTSDLQIAFDKPPGRSAVPLVHANAMFERAHVRVKYCGCDA